MASTAPSDEPQAAFELGAQRQRALGDCRSGQKLMVYAITLLLITYLIGGVLIAFPAPIPSMRALINLLLALVSIATNVGAIVLAILGVIRVARAFGYSTGMKVLFCVLLFLPLVSLLVLLYLNDKATTALKNAGYTVGLLGVRGPGPA